MKNNAGVMADRLIQQAEDCKEPALQIKLYELAARYAQVEAINRLASNLEPQKVEIKLYNEPN